MLQAARKARGRVWSGEIRGQQAHGPGRPQQGRVALSGSHGAVVAEPPAGETMDREAIQWAAAVAARELLRDHLRPPQEER
ncbi:hypothetical protein OHS70_37150 [Streptomyces sp. NBC_00390]|uniref:hypothetical protein n=1 Tax=Streptomyces sp. NBC_00390 TaxID=2975736 RepID=UPI002E1B4EFB